MISTFRDSQGTPRVIPRTEYISKWKFLEENFPGILSAGKFQLGEIFQRDISFTKSFRQIVDVSAGDPCCLLVKYLVQDFNVKFVKQIINLQRGYKICNEP